MNTSLRRRAAAFTLLAVGAAACGSTEQASTVTAPEVPLPKIVLSSNMSGKEAAAASPTADSRYFGYVNYTSYMYEGLDGDPGLAQVWRFDKAPVDLAKVKALAALFGIVGDPVALPEEQGGGYVVGSQNYSGPALYVAGDVLGSWSYSAGFASSGCLTPPIAVDDAVAVDSSQGSVTVAEPVPSGSQTAAEPVPTPQGQSTTVPDVDKSAPDTSTVDVPASDMPVLCAPVANTTSKEEAEQMLAEVLAAIGVDRAAVATETVVDDWSTSATATYVFGSVDSSVATYVGFSEGKFSWASGMLATPTLVGSYPQLAYQAAVDRFNERPMWPAMPYAVADVARSADSEAVVSSAGSDDTDVPSDRCGDVSVGTSGDMSVPEFVPEQPEPVTVKLSSPTAFLVQVWDAGGAVWLVPAYRFTAADGDYSYDVDVVSLVDEYMVAQDVPAVPATDVPGTDVAASSTAGSDGEPSSGAEPATKCGQLPAESTDALRAAAAEWVGLTEGEATAAAAEIGATLRVVSYDGNELAVTADWSATRVNVAVADGVVASVVSIG